jgi:cytochrome bd ubiquinol oxidase subunit II
MLDYATMQIIWWVLLGVLLTTFVLTDGFDLGVGILLPFVAKNDLQKRVIINSIGPVWESNQVWFVLGAGAIFAAWPLLYSLVFSTLYIPFLIVLVSLIMRPVSFDFRSKIDKRWWRMIWDTGIFISGFLPSFLFGVVIGNMFLGIDFTFDEFMVIRSGDTSLISFLSPFALLCGLFTLLVITMHGAAFLQLRTEGDIRASCRKVLKLVPILVVVLFILIAFYVTSINGFNVIESIDASTPATGFVKDKMVDIKIGGWLDKYPMCPMMLCIPAVLVASLVAVWFATVLNRHRMAFISSGISIISAMSTIGTATFPFLMPSRTDPSSSLTVWDASSSYYTLVIMLIAAVIMLPIVFSYISYVYYVVRHKVTEAEIQASSKIMY